MVSNPIDWRLEQPRELIVHILLVANEEHYDTTLWSLYLVDHPVLSHSYLPESGRSKLLACFR